MDAKQEKLQKEAKELVKIKKDENVALRKIIMARSIHPEYRQVVKTYA